MTFSTDVWAVTVSVISVACGLACGAPHQDVAATADAAPTAVAVDSGHLTTSVRVGSVVIPLDSNLTLGSVQPLLSSGRAPSRPTADTGSEVCFTMGVPSTGWLVLSSNALGGPEETVLGYEIRDGDQPPSNPAACLPSSTLVSDVSTDRGLRLGLSRAQVTAVLGQPDSVDDRSVRYRRSLPTDVVRVAAGGEPRVVRFYAISEVIVSLRADKVVAIHGWYVLTN